MLITETKLKKREKNINKMKISKQQKKDSSKQYLFISVSSFLMAYQISRVILRQSRPWWRKTGVMLFNLRQRE